MVEVEVIAAFSALVESEQFVRQQSFLTSWTCGELVSAVVNDGLHLIAMQCAAALESRECGRLDKIPELQEARYAGIVVWLAVCRVTLRLSGICAGEIHVAASQKLGCPLVRMSAVLAEEFCLKVP